MLVTRKAVSPTTDSAAVTIIIPTTMITAMPRSVSRQPNRAAAVPSSRQA